MSFNNALQRAVFARLRSFAPLTSIVSSYQGTPAIFFDVPQNVSLMDRYLVIYDFRMIADDTENTLGFSCNFDVHTWVTQRTASTIGNITQEVYNALNRFDSVLDNDAEYRASGISFVSQNIIRESDGITKHAIQEFTIQFERLVDYPDCNNQ